MQGSIYTSFSDMVIEQLGMKTWNALLEKVAPESEGVYTSGMQYDDSEIMALVGALSEITNTEAKVLVKSFGEFLFERLFASCPTDLTHVTNLKDFLLSIDGVIHKEVKRVYPKAYLPSFEYSDNPDGDLIMYYHSKRKLCHLSEGLIESAAKHFDEKITIGHPQCMHHGDDKCKLIISFES